MPGGPADTGRFIRQVVYVPNASPDTDPVEQARQQAQAELWHRGVLSWLLDSNQRRIYEAMRADPEQRHYLCCSRRGGKSFLLTVLAFETCLRKPNARVIYLAPWSKDAVDIVRDISTHILPSCPKELKPDYGTQDKAFQFKNGSTLRFKGTNGETAQYLRGGAADLVILDECGTMDDLEHVVTSVVDPMVLTTNGSVILATTPALTPEHPSRQFWLQAMADGCGHRFTLVDIPPERLSRTQKIRALKSAGETPEDAVLIVDGLSGPKRTTARREYFAEWVTDSAQAVVPEFTAEARTEIVRQYRRPPYFDAYTAMDPGMVDRTGMLFALWDVRGGKLVIEDEALLSGAGTPTIAQTIRDKERALWGDQAPLLRVSDIEKRLFADLQTEYGIAVVPASKGDSHGAIFKMRQMVQSRQLVINPRCVKLIAQLEAATWNKRASDFEHESSGQEDGQLPGHYDLVAALKYLVRTVVYGRNPYPAYYSDLPNGQRGDWRDAVATKAFNPAKSLRTDTPLSRRVEAQERKASSVVLGGRTGRAVRRR